MQTPEFFVGRQRIPPCYVRFLRPVSLALLAGLSLIALLLTLSQQSPGEGAWEDEATATLDGVADLIPYAVIRTEKKDHPGAVRTVFLVESGKHGARERIEPFCGLPIRVRGTLLHRDERWMLELEERDDAIARIDMTAVHEQMLSSPAAQALGNRRLSGEIIDSKCYLGAMKPGGGKTHKACASLCLRGGVPPMFVTRLKGQPEKYYVLKSSRSGPIDEEIIEYVGDPVMIEGSLQKVGDWEVLQLTPGSIKRR